MLEIVNYNEGEYEFPCLLVLGCFDGLHIGHAELLKKAKLQAKINGLDLGVMMFSEGKGGNCLYSFEERIALLEQYNVKFVLKIDFTNDFKNTKPLDFLQVLEDKLNVKAYMSGKDFRFGAGAKGKSSTLKNYCEDEENGVWYMPVKDVLSGTDKVSTTLIKSLLENGDISRANELLGREFSVSGTVAATDGNSFDVIYPENKVRLKNGTYSVKCTVGEKEYDGEALIDDALRLALYGLNEDITNQTVEIRFLACGEQSASADCQVAEDNKAAVEELAVTEESENIEIAENVVEAVEENAEEQPAEATSGEFTEDTDFEDELNEEFEEISEAQPMEDTETVAEASEPQYELQPDEETEESESYTLTEIAEETEDESAQPSEEDISVEQAEELPVEENEEPTEEAVEESAEGISEEEFSAEQLAEEITTEESLEDTPEDGENND